MSVDGTLADIDAALSSWESGPDSARWHADANGPDELAATLGTAQLNAWFGSMTAAATEAARLVQLTIVPAMDDFMKSMAQMGHTLSALQFPRQHRHCGTCHPQAFAPPLAINGGEYRRRQQARRKRRR